MPHDTDLDEAVDAAMYYEMQQRAEKAEAELEIATQALHEQMDLYTKDVDALRAKLAVANGVLSMAVQRLGGLVEGKPTARINFLQRIDALREIENTLLWYAKRLRHLPGNHRQPKTKAEWKELIELFQDAGERATKALGQHYQEKSP